VVVGGRVGVLWFVWKSHWVLVPVGRIHWIHCYPVLAWVWLSLVWVLVYPLLGWVGGGLVRWGLGIHLLGWWGDHWWFSCRGWGFLLLVYNYHCGVPACPRVAAVFLGGVGGAGGESMGCGVLGSLLAGLVWVGGLGDGSTVWSGWVVSGLLLGSGCVSSVFLFCGHCCGPGCSAFPLRLCVLLLFGWFPLGC